MVRFTSPQSRLSHHAASLPAVISAAIASLQDELHQSHSQVDVELDPSLATVLCPPSLDDTLNQLLRNVISRSAQCGGELSISACRTNRGVEIEIADSSPSVDDLPRNAFSRCTMRAAVGMRGHRLNSIQQSGFDVYHTRCPQGGQAWILVLTSRNSLARVA